MPPPPASSPLTGVLRVAKDSIFTGMNNLEVYTLLDRQYATCFGFTEPEVEALLKEEVQGLRLEGEELYGKLAIPNLEVLSIYKNLFRGWVEQALGDTRRQDLLRALLAGEAEACARHLQHWLLHSASLWDVAAYDPPERFYHGFVLGLLVSLGTRYEVLSNRESGYGRCHVLLMPRSAGQPGVALELKVRGEGESLEHALLGALSQLRERDYAQALRTRGATPVHELAFVFDGKQVHARRA